MRVHPERLEGRKLPAGGKEHKVVISTHTIGLQEQLITKDIPFLQQVIDVPIKVTLVKGRGAVTLTGKLRYQACNNSMCLPPKTLDVTQQVEIVK